ncbi:transcription factor HBP-1a [Dorcoceras hygrometricum]|uniref:Transcription factor HBP-1a n=1 Tax=Dorcoceras hygrometricum TaxID=472368 RepID=A0A2Z7BQM5_9LAMI|nr:transcription factor HBP-1a [Dorcoceras hygrometricum]
MGPISYTGPKTSRAARDRPEPNPTRNQPSRHRRNFSGAAACRRRRHHKTRGGSARDAAPSATQRRAQITRSYLPSCAQRRASSTSSGTTSLHERHDTTGCGFNHGATAARRRARPLREAALTIGRTQRGKRAARWRNFLRLLQHLSAPFARPAHVQCAQVRGNEGVSVHGDGRAANLKEFLSLRF